MLLSRRRWAGSVLLTSARVTLPVLVLSFGSSGVNRATQKEANPQPPAFDVINYEAQIEPDIAHKTITGRVVILLVARVELSSIELNCGELAIDKVLEGRDALRFERRAQRVVIWLLRPARARETRKIEIGYHGAPTYGIRFFPEQQQVYTVFSTSQWMVCVDAPDDRATFQLSLILPSELAVVANGRLLASRTLPNGKTEHQWKQDSPIPTYVFGFAAGRFRTITEKTGRVQLRYLAEKYSDEDVRRIFRDTPDMIRFYEMVAGIPYADAVYTQVLAAGNVAQEMSSFTAVREAYGQGVLSNERDTWLGAHELAHQWWGNMVTCRDWTHFWLNEGMASFIASAWKENRFGREEYLREIKEYRASYEKVRDAGKDRSLVFPDWNNPTAEDRKLVYDKGAYVLHLLREELGEQPFWTGIRQYTRAYFGKSVTTSDFQREMERSSGRALSQFFDRWIYLKQQ
jgi:aminopeptidase N